MAGFAPGTLISETEEVFGLLPVALVIGTKNRLLMAAGVELGVMDARVITLPLASRVGGARKLYCSTPQLDTRTFVPSRLTVTPYRK